MNFRKILPMIAAASLLASAGLSRAQEPATETPPAKAKGKNFGLEEVFVTARKRTERLQDVPLSIKALSGEDIADIGAKTFTEYADEIPSLNFASLGEGGSRINIRGLQAPLGVAVVAYLIDDIPQQDGGQPDTELFDIDNIQVLRGPQGTLYGAGAVGGAIIVRTKAPNLENFGWAYEGSYLKNSEGAATQSNSFMVNVPLLEGKVGFRGVGFLRNQDGWITIRDPDYNNGPRNNYSSETVIEEDANDKDIDGFRFALSYVPTDTLSFILRGSRQDSDIGAGAFVSPSLQDRWGEWTASRNALIGQNNVENNYDLGTFHAAWELPFADLEWISGVADNDVRTDQTVGITLPTEELISPSAPGIGTIRPPRPVVDQLTRPENFGIFEILDFFLINSYQVKSHEVRLVSNTEGRFQYTVGLFTQDIKRKAHAVVEGRGNFAGAADQTIFLWEPRQRRAAFAEVSFDFTERLNGILGLRHFEEDIEFRANVDNLDEKGSFSNTAPKIGLNFAATEDILIYAIAAEGFRSGGFNAPTTDPPVNGFRPTYESDLLTSYEIGINSQFFNKRVTFNASMFQASWDKVQMDLRLTNDQGRTQTITANLADAHSNGFEWEFTGIIDENWSMTLGGAYLDAELDEDAPFEFAEDGSGKIKAGSKLENVPEWAYNLAVNYNYFLDNGWSINASLSTNFTDDTIGSITVPDSTRAPSRQLWNGRVGLSGTGGKWSVTLFGRNLTDEDVSQFNFSNFDAVYRGPPREIGLRFAYNGEP